MTTDKHRPVIEIMYIAITRTFCNCWSFSVFIVTDAKTGGRAIYKHISVVNPLWGTILQKPKKKWRKNCRKIPDDAGHHHSQTMAETVIVSDNKANKR